MPLLSLIAKQEYLYKSAKEELSNLINLTFPDPDPGDYITGKRIEWQVKKTEWENAKKKRVIAYEKEIRKIQDKLENYKAQMEQLKARKPEVIELINEEIENYNNAIEAVREAYKRIERRIHNNSAFFTETECNGIFKIPAVNGGFPDRLILISTPGVNDQIFLESSIEPQ